MRTTFVNTLVELAHQDPRIILLTGDLGYTVLEPFAEAFPDRFFNVGVAEQNMMGLATGLAEAGLIPFVYSIATFASMRGYEFFRNGPVLHQLPVRVIGVGGGYEYGEAGATHHALEDIGIMRIYPDVLVIAPADYAQTKTALIQTWDHPMPVYYRLGKNETLLVPGLDGHFELERVQIVREGKDLILLSMGSIITEVVEAAERLAQRGIESTVVVVACINPSPTEQLADLLAGFPYAITVEAHYIRGGGGSLVSEIVAENALLCQVIRLGVKSLPKGQTGSALFMRQSQGICANAIMETVEKLIDSGKLS